MAQENIADTKTLTLGGQSVELTYLGSGHSDNLIVMKFPGEQALCIVDIVSAHRLPDKTIGAGRDNLDGMLSQIRKAESITGYNMEKYRNWFLHTQFLPLNIDGMYAHLGGKQ